MVPARKAFTAEYAEIAEKKQKSVLGDLGALGGEWVLFWVIF